MYMVQEEQLDEIQDTVAGEEFQDFREQIEEEVEEEGKEVSKENEDIAPSVHSTVPSWFQEGVEIPKDDIFRTESVGTEIIGPIEDIDDWWSEIGDLEYAEELKSLSDSENGTNYDEFNELTCVNNPIFFVGLQFSTPQLFRKVMVRWNVIRELDIKYLKKKNTMITAKCKYNGGWRIHSSPIGDTSTFQIKTFTSKHSYGKRHDNNLVDSRYLAKDLNLIV